MTRRYNAESVSGNDGGVVAGGGLEHPQQDLDGGSHRDEAPSLHGNSPPPQDEASSLQGDAASLQNENSSPQDDDTSLQDDAASPQNGDSSIQDNDTSPQDDHTIPQDDSTLPYDVAAPPQAAAPPQDTTSPPGDTASLQVANTSPHHHDAPTTDHGTPLHHRDTFLPISSGRQQDGASSLQGGAAALQEESTSLQGSSPPPQDSTAPPQDHGTPISHCGTRPHSHDASAHIASGPRRGESSRRRQSTGDEGGPGSAKRPTSDDGPLQSGGGSGPGSPGKRLKTTAPEAEPDPRSWLWGPLEEMKAKLDRLLSEEAKKELGGLVQNPNQYQIVRFVESWYPYWSPRPTGGDDDDSFMDALHRVASERNKRARDAETGLSGGCDQLLSHEVMDRLGNVGLHLDLNAQVRLAHRCLVEPGPDAVEGRGLVDWAMQADLWSPYEFERLAMMSLLDIDATDKGVDACESLSACISMLANSHFGDHNQLTWDSLDSRLQARFMQWSHRAEACWKTHTVHFIEAWIWHLIDDNFLSTTIKEGRDKDMFSTDLWAADDAIFETSRGGIQSWFNDAIETDLEDRVSAEAGVRDIRLQLWRALGAENLYRHHCTERLSADYIVRFLKRELRPLLVESETCDRDLREVAVELVRTDACWRRVLHRHVLVWNPEGHLGPNVAGDGRLSGFPFQEKSDKPHGNDPEVMGSDDFDLLPKVDYSTGPRPAFIVDLVYRPMLVVRRVVEGNGIVQKARRLLPMEVCIDITAHMAAWKEAKAAEEET